MTGYVGRGTSSYPLKDVGFIATVHLCNVHGKLRGWCTIHVINCWSMQFFPWCTLLETNGFPHLKMDGWKINFPLGFGLFSGANWEFRECIPTKYMDLVKCSSVSFSQAWGRNVWRTWWKFLFRKLSLGTSTARWIPRQAPMEIIDASYKTLLEHLLYDFHCETRKTAKWIFLASASSDFIHIPYTSRVLSSDRLADLDRRILT